MFKSRQRLSGTFAREMICKEMEQGGERKSTWGGGVIAGSIQSKQRISEKSNTNLCKMGGYLHSCGMEPVLFQQCCCSVQLFAELPLRADGPGFGDGSLGPCPSDFAALTSLCESDASSAHSHQFCLALRPEQG